MCFSSLPNRMECLRSKWCRPRKRSVLIVKWANKQPLTLISLKWALFKLAHRMVSLTTPRKALRLSIVKPKTKFQAPSPLWIKSLLNSLLRIRINNHLWHHLSITLVKPNHKPSNLLYKQSQPGKNMRCVRTGEKKESVSMETNACLLMENMSFQAEVQFLFLKKSPKPQLSNLSWLHLIFNKTLMYLQECKWLLNLIKKLTLLKKLWRRSLWIQRTPPLRQRKLKNQLHLRSSLVFLRRSLGS